MANDPAASAALEYRKRKAESVKGTIEHREFEVHGLEVRTLDDGTLRMAGYGSITEVEYPVGPYTEVIRRGAFKRTLSESPDTVLLFGHDGMPLARTKTNTLVMEEDAMGLKWTADLDAEDPDSRVLARKVERGLIDQCSFAFLVTDQDWSDDWTLRSIKSVSLHRGDISLVTMGANEATSVSNVRSLEAAAAIGTRSRSEVLGALREVRAGAKFSAKSLEILTEVLSLTDDAEQASGNARSLLDGLVNPETDTEAGDSVERSIDSEKGLCAAIRAVIREPDHDERRAEIITRAAELDLTVMVPRDWAPDGALPEGRALATQEQRETHNDTYTALDGALHDLLVTNGDCYYVWVQDFTDTEVIYYSHGDLWKAPYTLVPGGEVTIGEGAKVRPVTEYVERAAETPAPVVVPDYTTRAAEDFELLMLREGRR